MLNKSGPRREPWITSHVFSNGSNEKLKIDTKYFMFYKYALNQFNTDQKLLFPKSHPFHILYHWKAPIVLCRYQKQIIQQYVVVANLSITDDIFALLVVWRFREKSQTQSGQMWGVNVRSCVSKKILKGKYTGTGWSATRSIKVPGNSF